MNQIKRFLLTNVVDIIIASVIWNKPYKATRKTWWLSKLYFLVFFILSISPVDILSKNMFMIFFISVFTFGLYTQINISIKRFHDIGLPGYLIWLSPIPLVGFILFLVLGFCHPESETQNKMTLKKLFLVSFSSKNNLSINNKISVLAFLLSIFLCFNLYVFILLSASIVGGLATGFFGGQWKASFGSFLVAFSVIIAILTFIYSSRLILKRRDRK